MLLIDEIDRTDEAFEAFLLEVLSDFQVTVPELGTIKADKPPVVIVTSNRTREVHDALKRRCLYHWVGYPNAERELAILRAKVPGVGKKLSEQVVAFVQALRKEDLFKSPGVAETLDWAGALTELECSRARSGHRVRHARRAAEVSGRHRPARSEQGQAIARRGEGGAAGGGVVMAEREGVLADNILYFARALRAAGLPVGPGAVLDALRSGGDRECRHARRLLLDAARRVREAA